ncbi:TetR/AcrR family transcriptional regulator; helix-turn-helix transcriptional regulator [Mesorhizobium sp. BR1-1-9]|uniref:TetR/AcrR family transcriptional regulator n=1 Tax=unclassified Mesorhizobium TaxID=325217 RepID=UPI001CD0A3EF|nr:MULTISPECIES: TetR/AcrR family transcriptional regulator [unclassified Mesorhizobium]MBZ9873200.1 TetR/AcrR family transcriptional regulator; helix-turn-helix transcriptional regulator [Mesorhizobium sp. BR1-1-9]MBZ9944989.1 TetR/AcrR family transcriptional regulator; helix-turn-helix transcriptional regulator [Mesorhizobium sp. BR1-1-13]
MVGVRQFDEGEALDKALTLFWQKGYSQTTMQDLAEATGVQRGSLYNAYGDKETLFLRVFGVYRDRYVDRMREAMDKPGLREALESFFGFVIESMRTGAPTRGCLSTKTAVGIEELDESIRSEIRDLLDEIEAALHERLSRPGAAEQLTLTPKDAARLIVVHTRGLVVIERVYREEQRMRSMAELLIQLLLKPKLT